MAGVDYTNPEALIQNTSAPPGVGGPDFLLTGHGPVQGYLQGQAANQSQDLLNMAKQQQAMSMQKQAGELSEWNRFSPYRASNVQSEAELNKSKATQADYEAKIKGLQLKSGEEERRVDQANFLGQYAQYMKPGNDVQNMAVHQEAINAFKRTYGEDPGQEITQYDPQKTPEMFAHAKDIGVWGQQKMAAARAMAQEEGKVKGNLITQTQQGEKEMLASKLETEKDIATAHNTSAERIAALSAKQHPAYLASKLFDARGHVAQLNQEGYYGEEAKKRLSGTEQALLEHDQDIIGMANPFLRQYAEAAGRTATIEGQLSGATQPGTGGAAVQKSMEATNPRRNPYGEPPGQQQTPAQRQPKTVNGQVYTPIPGTGKTGLPLYQGPDGKQYEIKE